MLLKIKHLFLKKTTARKTGKIRGVEIIDNMPHHIEVVDTCNIKRRIINRHNVHRNMITNIESLSLVRKGIVLLIAVFTVFFFVFAIKLFKTTQKNIYK